MDTTTSALTALNNAIRNRDLVRISDGHGWATGIVGIALGINRHGTVKVGFIDDGGNYTGDWTRVPASAIELLEDEDADSRP